jgi:hypothetical protein
MKNKKLTPYQSDLIKMLFKGDKISTTMVQSKLRCSFWKACELIDWAAKNGYISDELPRTVNHDKIKLFLKSESR